MRLLLVEDDAMIGEAVHDLLRAQDHAVDWVRDGAQADAALAAQGYDLVLLDLGLPDGDGLTLLARLRRDRQDTPVLILTARDALQDRLTGLDCGADDYLVKPFALAELLSRVRALARRSYGLVNQALELRGLVLHETTMRVTVGGQPVELSRSEFELLCLLVKRADRVLTRRLLEEQVLPGGLGNDSNVLDVHMSNLRRKIGPGYIRTVRGVGYVIDRAEQPAPGPR